jgi:hypothetical protein
MYLLGLLGHFNFGVGDPPYYWTHLMLRAQLCPHESHSHLPPKHSRPTFYNLMCICSLGPSITNFDLKPILAKWLEAPFMQKNGRGRSLQDRKAERPHGRCL